MSNSNNSRQGSEVSFDRNGHMSQFTYRSGSNNNENILVLNQRDPNMRQRRLAEREAQRITNRINQVIENANNANFIRRAAREADQYSDRNDIRTPIMSRNTSMASGVHSNNVREIPYNNFNVQRPINETEFQNRIQQIVQSTISPTKRCHFTRAGQGGSLLNTRWPWQYGSGWIKNVNKVYARYVQRRATQQEVIGVLEQVPDGCCLCGC